MSKFDIDLRVRGSYDSSFGRNYLILKQNLNVDGSVLIRRVFSLASEIIQFKTEKEAEAMKRKLEAEADLRRFKTGEK